MVHLVCPLCMLGVAGQPHLSRTLARRHGASMIIIGEQLEQRHDGAKVAEDPNANAFEVSAEDVAAHRLAIRGRVLHRK